MIHKLHMNSTKKELYKSTLTSLPPEIPAVYILFTPSLLSLNKLIDVDEIQPYTIISNVCHVYVYSSYLLNIQSWKGYGLLQIILRKNIAIVVAAEHQC